MLKATGAGVAVATLPALPGCSVDAEAPATQSTPAPVDETTLYAGTLWVDAVIRRDDLVVLKLGLVNLEVRDKTVQPVAVESRGNLYLARSDAGKPAYLVVVFQPQHILEECFDESQAGHAPPGQAGSAIPIKARMAQESRLVFAVPGNVVAIPYELDKILAAISGFPLTVPPTAKPQAQDLSTLELAPVFAGLLAAVASSSGKSKRGIRAARQRAALKAFYEVNGGATGTANLVIDGAEAGRPTPTKPLMPTPLQTSIELPFRLLISPNSSARFEHAAVPVQSATTKRVELWHTRLATPQAWQRTVRAVWTRDPGFDASDWQSVGLLPSPFYADLSPTDRSDIVHLSTNTTLLDEKEAPRARAVDVNMLALSALGGWLDTRGTWNDPSKTAGGPSLINWDHHAPMGRDQKVRVVRVGYLYPFGHKAVWVEVTERKFRKVQGAGDWSDTAYLWKREFIIVKDALKVYESLPDPMKRGLPFKAVRMKTLVTPLLDPKGQKSAAVPGAPKSSWALVNERAFAFEVQAHDHDGNVQDFTSACIWLDFADCYDPANASAFFNSQATRDAIAAHWAKTGQWGFGSTDHERRRSELAGQRIAYAPCDAVDDTRYCTANLALKAGLITDLKGAPFAPQLEDARLDVDAIRGLSGKSTPTAFSYFGPYLTNGFEEVVGAANRGHVFLSLAASEAPSKLDFNKQSHKSGGFVAPSMGVTALSRKQGIVAGDPALAGKMDFKPDSFFDENAIPAKLFGCISLFSIIKAVAGDDFLKQAPKFITESLQAVEAVFGIVRMGSDLASDPTSGLLAQLGAIEAAIGAFPALPDQPSDPSNPVNSLPPAAKALYGRLYDRAKSLGLDQAKLTAQVASLKTAITQLIQAADALATKLDEIAQIDAATDLAALAQGIVDCVLGGGVQSGALPAFQSLGTALKGSALPIQDGLRAGLDKAVKQINKAIPDPQTFKTLVTAFVKAEEAIKDLHINVEWAPELEPWPKGAAIFWPNDVHGFRIGIDVRAKDSGGIPAGAEIYASLSDFELRLIGNEPFIKLVFDKLAFKAGTSGKIEIDCVFRGLHFDGPLKFVEVLRSFIPLDGFSDPPNVDVDEKGLRAGFTLPLPSIAIGVFALDNLSFSAGFEIPFIGPSLAVNFSFCSRESPFVLTVCMLGGGGFVGITLCPDGMRLLEISFEAQACLSVDFGVASGSIGIAIGIYFAMEQDNVKLSGYLRFRGEVQIMGFISVCIELQMDLNYESAHDKLIGHAKLEIEVTVLCFSGSVTIEVTRKFKGSNGDPTFRQLMEPMGNVVPWDDYCDAFAPVAA